MLEKFFGRVQGKPFFQKRFSLLEDGLFSKSPSPIKESRNLFFTYFSFRQKRKVGKRKGIGRLTAQ
jgi:hypothetical protein